MAQTKLWKCDGCDATTETALEAEQSEFYSIKVTAGAWGDNFHLCKDCHERLMKQIDPKQWPRVIYAERAA